MKKIILLLITLLLSFTLLYSNQQSRLLKKLNDRLYNDKSALRFYDACTGADIEGATVKIVGIGTALSIQISDMKRLSLLNW